MPDAESDAPRRRTESEARRCSQEGCPGDGRYQPPGKGHLLGCQHNAVAWVWETVTPPAESDAPIDPLALTLFGVRDHVRHHYLCDSKRGIGGHHFDAAEECALADIIRRYGDTRAAEALREAEFEIRDAKTIPITARSAICAVLRGRAARVTSPGVGA